MTDTKQFSTAVVISAYTGRLACGIGDIYEVLNFITGDNLMTHQLPGASRAAMPSLAEQFPWLADVHLPDGGGANFTEAVARLLDAHGLVLEVARPSALQWMPGNALLDLIQLAEGRPVIAVRGDA